MKATLLDPRLWPLSAAVLAVAAPNPVANGALIARPPHLRALGCTPP